MSKRHYLNYLSFFTLKIEEDVRAGYEKYGDSCLKRGSTGLFMMLARKWDRFEKAMSDDHYNLDEALANNPEPDGLIDDIDDLIAYLVILRTDVIARSSFDPKPYVADGKPVRDTVIQDHETSVEMSQEELKAVTDEMAKRERMRRGKAT